MVAGFSGRSATIDAILDSGSWEDGEPTWSGVPDFTAPDGAKSVTWIGQGGSTGVGDNTVVAKACESTESVVIKIHEPQKGTDSVSYSSLLLSGYYEAVDDALSEMELISANLTLTGDLTREQELVDVYNSPEVDVNVDIDGKGELKCEVEGEWTTGPITVFGITIVDDFLMKMNGDLLTNASLDHVKHNWSVADGDWFSGWTGAVNVAGQLKLSAQGTAYFDVNTFGVRGVRVTAGGTFGASATGEFNKTALRIVVKLSTNEIKLKLGLGVTLTNGKTYGPIAEPELGWLNKSITFPLNLDPAQWQQQ